MIAALTLLPPLAAILVARRYGFRAALVFVALPALLLLPSHYAMDLPGAPDATFWNYAFLVALAALLLGKDRRLFRPHPLDLLVVLYVLLCVVTEFVNKDFGEARNMFARCLAGVVAPYVFGRAAARADGLLAGILGVLCLVGIAVGLQSPWEARMGSTPFDWPRNVWPGGSEFARTLYRNGMRRTEGPFAQPICQGLYFAMLLPLALWMRDAGLARRRGLVLLAAGAFAVGLFLSQSRGPLAGAVLATVLTLAAWSRRRALLLTTVLVLGGIVLLASFDTLRQHWFITRAEAVTEEQHSAAYRWEMLENYLEVVAERPLEGFGRNQIPVVKGQDSIDNQYLFLALTHGLPAAVAYLGALVAPVLALWSRLPRFRHDDRTARLGWAVSSVLAMVAIVQVSVYAGTQTEQVLFLLEGLAVGLWIRLGETRAKRTQASGALRGVAFRDGRAAPLRRPVSV